MLHLLDQSSVGRGAGWMGVMGCCKMEGFEALLRVAKEVRTTHSWVPV